MKATGLRQLCRRAVSGATRSYPARALSSSTQRPYEKGDVRRPVAKRPLAAITGGWSSMEEEQAMPSYLTASLTRAMKRADDKGVIEAVRQAVKGSERPVPLPPSVASRVLGFFVQAESWAGIKAVMGDMAPGTFPVSLQDCHRIQQAFAGPRHWQKGLSLLLMMQARGLVADDALNRAVVQQLADAGRLLSESESFLARMRQKGPVLPGLLYCLMDAMADRALVRECQARWEEAKAAPGPKQQLSFLNLMLKAYSRAGQAEEAVALLKQQASTGARVDLVSFNTALAACARQARPDLGEAVFRLMKNKRRYFTPDTRTYAALLDAYARSHDVAGASHVFDRLLASEVKPSIHCYAVLMKALARAGDLEGVTRCMRDMEAAGMPLNEVVYSTAVYAWGVKGHLEQAMAYLKQAERAGLCNQAVYFSMLHNYAKHALADDAVALLENMKARGTWPNTKCYNAGMEAARRAGRYELCMQLFQDLQSSGLKPDSHTCNNMMTAAFNCGRPEVALEVARTVLDRGHKVREATWATVLTMCGQEDRMDGAEAIFDTLRHARYPHLDKLRNLLVVIFANGNRLELALRALHIPAPPLSPSSSSPSSSSSSTGDEQQQAATAAAGGGLEPEEEASRVASSEEELRLTQAPLTALILCCGRQGQWPVALYLLDEARWHECVDTVMVSAAMQCLHRACPTALRLLGPQLFGWALAHGLYPAFLMSPEEAGQEEVPCLDLHQLTAGEARASLNYYLQLDGPRDGQHLLEERRFELVVGKGRQGGAREPDGQSLLNREVRQLLRRGPWRVQEHQTNSGRLVVTYDEQQRQEGAGGDEEEGEQQQEEQQKIAHLR